MDPGMAFRQGCLFPVIRQLECDGRRLSLPDLLERTGRALRRAGVGGGVVAAVEVPPLERLLLLLALPAHRLPFLSLDPALPAGLRRRLLALAGASWMAEPGGGFRPLDFPSPPDRIAPPAAAAEHRVQLLLATSGTTAEPSLVALTGTALHASAVAAGRRLGLEAEDCWLVCLPLFHVAAIQAVLRTRHAGAALVLHSRFDPETLLRRLARGDVTHLSLVPTQLHRLLEAAPDFRPPDSLRVVLLGGAPATRALVERGTDAGWPLCPTYGLTEAASMVAVHCPGEGPWSPGLAGRPLPHLEVAVDRDGRIRLRGRALAGWRLDSRGAFALAGTDGWYTTGDLGRLDGQGRLRILGRADEAILSGGEKVQPPVVEAVLAQCPGVEAVAVAGLPDARWGQRLVAAYLGEAPPDAVLAWARKRLRGPYLPAAFHRLSDLPRTPLGKIRRDRLRRILQALEARTSASRSPAGSGTERASSGE